MKHALNIERDVTIFDCDGVIYSWTVYGGIENAKEFCSDIMAHVVPLLLPSLNAQQAKTMGRKSYEETGDGLRYFIDRAEQEGFDREEFRDMLHEHYHIMQLLRVKEKYPQIITPCAETTRLFEALSGRIRCGMISQSCRNGWLKPLLSDRGILDHFQDEHIFGFREFGWHEKSLSAKGLEMIMDAMKVNPSRVIFVEDTKKNLIPVRKKYPEVLNVYLYDFNPHEPELDYVDLHAQTLPMFLSQLVAAHHSPQLQAQVRNHNGLRLQHI